MKPTFLSTTSENARMAQLFGYVRDAVIMLDPQGVVGFWSAGASRILGRQAPDALNRFYLDLIPKSCRAAQTPLIHRALDGEAGTAEWQTVGPDGGPLWLEGDFRPITDDSGRRIGCVILLHDVTRWRAAEAARRATETALRESEARYRLLTENTTDMIGRLTPDGEFLYASPGCAGCSGPTPTRSSTPRSASGCTPRTNTGCGTPSTGWPAAGRPTRWPTGPGTWTVTTSGANRRSGPSATRPARSSSW